MLPVGGHARGRPLVRREAPPALARTLTARSGVGAPAPARLTRTGLTWWSYAVLACFAFVLNGFGPVVLNVRDELGLSRTVTGLHSTGLATGILIAGLAGEALRRRTGWRGLLWLGTAGLALGVTVLGLVHTVAMTLPATVLASGLAIGAGPLALGALADAHGIADASWIVLALLVAALGSAGRGPVFERR